MKLHIIYPNTLIKDISVYKKVDEVWMVEEPLFFTQFKFHQQKLVLHRASMKSFQSWLKENGVNTRYFDSSQLTDTQTILKKASQESHSVQIFYPSDYLLEKRINATFQTKVQWIDNPIFINTRSELATYFEPKKDSDHLKMEHWYRKERKKRDILMDGDNPRGGKWNYDKQNRQALPKDIELPDNPEASHNTEVKEAIEYVKKNFGNHYGDAEKFWLPTTHESANDWFENFLSERFKSFGPYEDAIKKSSKSILFHSALSPLLNTGLLEVKDVIHRATKFANRSSKVELNSLEGFLRQLVGWREFMHGLYLYRGSEMRNKNFFKHKRNLPERFWNAGDGELYDPIEDVINKVLDTAYAHHIERLMIMSNFFILTEINPHHVYGWFMELFIDSYDWVMVPNVYSMGLFADGGIMATKPYIASSNYLTKMSDYSRKNKHKDHWSAKWDALYWRFMYQHRNFFEKNHRLAKLTSYLDRLSENELKDKLNLAASELSRLTKMPTRFKREDDQFLTSN